MPVNNINFGFDKKKRFTIDGDENRVIELDTSDVGIVSRFEESADKIKKIETEANRLSEIAKRNNESDTDDADGKEIKEFTALFSGIERSMRDIIDYIFDGRICDVILGKSSVFSPVNGKYKFEQIIETLLGLYESDIKSETAKINSAHIHKHTSKYISK